MLIMYFKRNIFDNVDPGFFFFKQGGTGLRPKIGFCGHFNKGKTTLPNVSTEAKILIGGLGLGRGRVNEQHIRFLREKKTN